MDNSALYPPNHQALSDTVITDVIQRIRPPSSTLSSPSNANILPPLQKSQPSVHLAVTSDTSNGHFRCPSLSVHNNQRTVQHRTVFEDAAAENELRRQRNRMHQARHKMKQRKKVEGLEASIQQLREEVQELKLQREVVSVGAMSNTTVWNVAAEYFRVFRYGVRASEMTNTSSVMVAQVPSFRAEAQRSFLLSQALLWWLRSHRFELKRSVVTYDGIDCGCGVDALMENWRFVSKFHPDIDVQLVCLENDVDGFMVGRTLGTLTITENTLMCAFPHLIKDEKDRERMQLADKLLGQQLVMRGSIHFEWDNDERRIVRVQHKADLLTPLLKLLGNLEEVSRVFDKALVTPASTSVAWDCQ
ncbi:hypothetical protein PHPALM_29848 [Phytophthora palmivora]|uniref:BZIP domain-containing protein n=1 Tax=Phytophthora palmivora TaxID=4796 RepID=A0A2P4X6L1_9STRA|nr:hypothetical protein PHPALM_29848 [Phytophthora palmivora]